MDEWWTNMSVDACWWIWDVCWMMYDALMHWCVMHWCMLNRLMCVKCMYIFCNHNCILYWFFNCFNVLILIFVFVCLSGFLYVSCTCNKTVTPYDGVCLHPHTHEPVTFGAQWGTITRLMFLIWRWTQDMSPQIRSNSQVFSPLVLVLGMAHLAPRLSDQGASFGVDRSLLGWGLECGILVSRTLFHIG